MSGSRQELHDEFKQLCFGLLMTAHRDISHPNHPVVGTELARAQAQLKRASEIIGELQRTYSPRSFRPTGRRA